MNKFVVLALLIPAVFSRVPFNLSKGSLNQDITIEDIKEIQELKTLTKKLEESGEQFQHPLKSSLNVNENDVKFYIYNRHNNQAQAVLLGESQNVTSVSAFDTNLNTIVIIHGWHNNYNSTFNFIVGEAYLKLRDVNIITVDWDGLAKSLYLIAYSAVPHIGRYVGQFLNTISTTYDYSLDKVSLVGHSLGAHISGYAGQETNGALHSITGLDPAGPLYSESKPDERLSETDAQYVQSIHTNGNMLGVDYSLARADFWPNGGESQPGCGLDITGSCSHGRSYDYFTESLSSDEFIAKNCDSYSDYTDGKCKDMSPTVMGGPDVNTTITGNFYLETNSDSPYALGEIGL